MEAFCSGGRLVTCFHGDTDIDVLRIAGKSY